VRKRNNRYWRAALPNPQKALSSELYNPVHADELEQRISKLWSSELGIERASGEDNFFLHGGDSIKVIRMISQINKSFQIQLKSRELYKEPTLGYLVHLVRERSSQYEVLEIMQGYAAIQQAKERIVNDPQQFKNLPDDWEDIYPLSSIQQSMVFYSRLKPNEPIYLDQFCYSFDIPVFESHWFQQALQLLVQKHPILRTTFMLTKFSEAMQVVLHHIEVTYWFIRMEFYYMGMIWSKNCLKLLDIMKINVIKARSCDFLISRWLMSMQVKF
jgi:tyrocidine synthetase-3